MQQEHTQLMIGQIVHLNSGSPELEVVAIKGENVEVEWRNERDNIERTTFPTVCVQ